MINTKYFCVLALALAIALGPRLTAQVQTEVPPVVPGAKPDTVEHIEVHGTALEGNLEADAVELFKIGARVRHTARCVRFHLATGWPFQNLFRDVAFAVNSS